MQALGTANDIRLRRADLKQALRTGQTTVVAVLLACPLVAESMTITDLLMTQHRWGRSRCRRFLMSIPMTETKTVGSLTQRQRDELVSRLGAA
jgi:hypothetical protein